MSVHAWSKCSRPRCRLFNAKQSGPVCGSCLLPFRHGVAPDPDVEPDAEIDETLLLRSRERLTKELARIDERLAELALLKKGSGR